MQGVALHCYEAKKDQRHDLQCLYRGIYSPDGPAVQRYCSRCNVWFHADCLVNYHKDPREHCDLDDKEDPVVFLAKSAIRRGGTSFGPVGNGKLILAIRDLYSRRRKGEDIATTSWMVHISERDLSYAKAAGCYIYKCHFCKGSV